MISASRTVLCVLLGLAYLYPAFAKEVQDCSAIQHGLDRRACIYEEYEKLDLELNQVYQDFRSFLKSRGDEDQEAQEHLKKAQLAWIAYRDNDCELEAQAYAGGTLYPEVHTHCLMNKTKNRIKEIRYFKDVWDM